MTCVQYLLCMCDWCLQIAHSCVSCTLICVRLVALLHCRVGWTSLQQAPVKVAVDEETRKAKLDGLLTVLLWHMSPLWNVCCFALAFMFSWST